MPRKPIKALKAALRADTDPADQILTPVVARLVKRFGGTPVGPRETVAWARTLMLEEDAQVASGRLTKAGTLRTLLRKFTGLRGFERGVAGISKGEGVMSGDVIAADGTPTKPKRSKAEKKARRVVKQQGLKWKGVPKDVRKTLIADAKNARALAKIAKRVGGDAATAASVAGAGGGAAADDGRLALVATDASDPLRAAAARAELEKRGGDLLKRALATPGDSQTVAESLGGFGIRPSR